MAASKNNDSRLPVAKTYKIYIDGKFPRTESGRYQALRNSDDEIIANICRSSRKDFRNAVVAARTAQSGWANASAYLRGQIIYRIAEMLEGRAAQFRDELVLQGMAKRAAAVEVDAAIDRLIYYAGWADKYTQIQSSVNPVASSHFNFSMPEPTGVVALIAPRSSGLLGLVSSVAAAVVGGNSIVVLASEQFPLTAVSFAEVIHASDVPAGVINLLTGQVDELAKQFATHMDVNALVLCEGSESHATDCERAAADNIKRVVNLCDADWKKTDSAGPYHIGVLQETKTTWHPVAN